MVEDGNNHKWNKQPVRAQVETKVEREAVVEFKVGEGIEKCVFAEEGI